MCFMYSTKYDYNLAPPTAVSNKNVQYSICYVCLTLFQKKKVDISTAFNKITDAACCSLDRTSILEVLIENMKRGSCHRKCCRPDKMMMTSQRHTIRQV